ncbi:MAG: sensor histidine kinase [Desulfobulbaceae bacterium]|jgi:Na+/proline symporter/signal transduction histidine kinase|nr:sensor histidine kinase [Desulfobulbaceae bacterium]HKJ13342.1 sensor histidine kinase [Desulfobulbales bacterium]
MLQEWVILLVSLCYLGTLFAIAYYADWRSDRGKSIISNPYIYTLSIAVYCTAWTFYGSVGRAAETGIGFMPIYLGPTLMAALWWFLLRKIIRIAKVYRITSIADFLASRYGKSSLIGGLVTIIAVVGIMPYISLQLKAVSTSYTVMLHYPDLAMIEEHKTSLWNDNAFSVAMIMAAFSILFGTRHIDATERHEGMVAAIAFESMVKLLAFSAAGIFITFIMFDGPVDLFDWAIRYPETSRLMQLEVLPGGYTNWFTLIFLSMMAIMFLPRQFQVLVVENVNEEHIRKAAWLFPIYLLAINIFVLPIAFAGMLMFPEGHVAPDIFVLALPLTEGQDILALFIYLGGLSAATGMVIVATIALSTMVCNDLVMPVLLRMLDIQQVDLGRVLLFIRRFSIVAVLLLGYLYYRFIGESYTLVTMGLVSFAAAAQFSPAILFGIFWKDASRRAAVSGLLAGFLVWFYTLLLPSFAKSGWLPLSFLEYGPFGIEQLRPYQLFGLNMFDPITHAVFWSMLVNAGLLVIISLLDRQNTMDRIQASLFVDVYRHSGGTQLWKGKAMITELKGLLARFIGPGQSERAFANYSRSHNIDFTKDMQADAELVEFAERLLSGAIGAASARVMVSSVVEGEEISTEGVMKIIDETSQVLEYSHQLEEKSIELEAATKELQEANKRLKELDRLKDEFVSTVSHELRTPLTSVRAFSEILHDNADMGQEERKKFLDIMVKETERLTRLINEVLDLAKIESGRADWHMEIIDLTEILKEAVAATSQLFHEKSVAIVELLPSFPIKVFADRDRIIQVVINLLSNAAKFSPQDEGRVTVRLYFKEREIRVEVADNGPGIHPDEQQKIFEKFKQITDLRNGKPKGTGLGLAICRRIIEYHNGYIWVESIPGEGAKFVFSLPD